MYGSKCSRPVPVNEPLVREHLTGAKTRCIQLVNKGGTAIIRPFIRAFFYLKIKEKYI
jgi:hypothetical protein